MQDTTTQPEANGASLVPTRQEDVDGSSALCFTRVRGTDGKHLSEFAMI